MSEITDGLDCDGWRLIDRDGARIGNVEQLCPGAGGAALEWAVVSTGVLGLRTIVVPLHGAALAGAAVQVPIAIDRAMGAPPVDVKDGLSAHDERRLLEHYGGAAATPVAVAAPSLWQRSPATTTGPRR
jgi:hypothetical protein